MKTYNYTIKPVLFISILYSILLYGCNVNPNSVKAAVEIDLSKNNKLSMNNDFILIEDIIPLETNDSCIIGGINKIILNEDLLFVIDFMKTHSTLCFDKNGKFMNRLSKTGKSEGEYVTNRDFIEKADKSGYYLFDKNMDKLIEFDVDLNYIKEVKVPISINSLVALNDGRIIVERSSKNSFFVNIYDTEFNLLKEQIPRPEHQLHYDFNNPYPFKLNNRIVTYNPSFSNYIYTFDGESFKKKYYIKDEKGFPNKLFFEENKGVHPARILSRFKEQEFLSFLDFYENDIFLLLKYYRGDKKYITIYQKQNNTVTSFKTTNNSLKSIVLNNVIGIDTTGRFISYIFPYEYYSLDKQMPFLNIPDIENRNIPLEDNPIILFFNLDMI